MNQYFYIQYDKNTNYITNISQQNHEKDSDWVLVAVPKHELSLFTNNYTKCQYFDKWNAWLPSESYIKELISSDKNGIIPDLQNQLNNISNNGSIASNKSIQQIKAQLSQLHNTLVSTQNSLSSYETSISASGAHASLSNEISSLSKADEGLKATLGPNTKAKLDSLAKQFNNFDNSTQNSLSGSITTNTKSIASNSVSISNNASSIKAVSSSVSTNAQNINTVSKSVTSVSSEATNEFNQANTTENNDKNNLQQQITSNKNNISSNYEYDDKPLISNADLDTFLKGGVFNIDGTSSKHGPNTRDVSTNHVCLIVYADRWYTNWNQFIITWNGFIYHRSKTGGFDGSWSNWEKMAEQSAINSLQGNINYINGQLDDKQNQIAQRPTWNDENWTRNQLVPSLANSAKSDAYGYAANIAAPSAATNAMNQANAYTNGKINDIINNHISPLLNYQNGNQQYNVDLNTIFMAGTYSLNDFNGQIKNSPNTNGNYNNGNFLIVYDLNFNNFEQIYISYTGVIYTRNYTAGNWGRWQRLLVDNDIGNIQDQINNRPTWADENWTRQHTIPETINSKYNDSGNNLITNTDINNFKQGGIYFIDGTTCQNCPIGNHLFLLEYADNSWTNWNQFAIGFNGDMYTRNKTGGWNSAWGAWRKFGYIDTASNEDDARNKSNQTPGMLFIYPD